MIFEKERVLTENSHADASSKKQIQALLEKEFDFSEHD